jgi:hypothetical protein
MNQKTITNIEYLPHSRTIPDLGKSRQYDTIPQTLIHFNDAKAEFLTEASFNPLLRFSNVA